MCSFLFVVENNGRMQPSSTRRLRSPRVVANSSAPPTARTATTSPRVGRDFSPSASFYDPRGEPKEAFVDPGFGSPQSGGSASSTNILVLAVFFMLLFFWTDFNGINPSTI